MITRHVTTAYETAHEAAYEAETRYQMTTQSAEAW